MKIEIHAIDKSLHQRLFPKGLPPYGAPSEQPSGIVIESRMLPGKQFADGATVLEFLVTNATAVGLGILSSWLYDLIKAGVSRLRIDGDETKLDAAAIEQAVLRALERANAGK